MSQELTAGHYQPPAHVAALLQAEGMNYDPATFQTMSLEQHAEEGFKGLKVSVLSAVYSGMHFVQAIEQFKQAKLAGTESSKRLDDSEKAAELESVKRLTDFKSPKQFVMTLAEQRGVGYQTIYNMIAVYNLFARAPEKIVQTFGRFEYTKLIELKNLDKEDLEALADGNEVYGLTLETAQTCSVRELKAILQAHRGEIQRYKQTISAMQQKVDTEAKLNARLFDENRQLKQWETHRPVFLDMRHHLIEDAETIQGALLRMRKVVEFADRLAPEFDQDAMDTAIAPLMSQLQTLKANCELLLLKCYQRYPIDPHLPLKPPELTRDELCLAQDMARWQDERTKQILNYKPDKPDGKRQSGTGKKPIK